VTAGRSKQGSEPPSRSVKRAYAAKAGETPTIVLVDDDPSVLRALSRLLRGAGFRVVAFDRPGVLLASAIPKANACMVVDINLPELNGVELCSALAASGRSLPAILITGRDDPATRRLIQKARPVAALFKPFDKQALLDAITNALARSRG
jgi:FixJ family two-component response regulator